jgi:hypothetical protein
MNKVVKVLKHQKSCDNDANEYVNGQIACHNEQDVQNLTVSKPSLEEKHMCTLNTAIPLHKQNYIQIKIKSQDIWCLLDTGAQVSVMSCALWKKLFSDSTLLESNVNLVTATGNPVKILGKANIEVYIEGKMINIGVYVADKLRYDVIIGLDVLNEHKMVIDFSSQTVKINPQMCVIAQEQTQILPRSETLIMAGINKTIPDGIQGIYTGSMQVGYLGLVPAKVLALTKQQTIPIRLLNPNDFPIKIHKGTNLGIFQILP